ncbi:hypothetical protein IFM89_006058 [Coptis chinensis]|uniref:GDSL esterase/lipase n=1 Tax=Coptis chinensis TaxID=261450 RepID=A0A835LGL1_9MAGN|nr:hypothetical protein IFM89_006058 [Coptis chinensis]
MGFSSNILGVSLLVAICFSMVHGQPLVPGMFIFGDSVADAGNNNKLFTIVKANFLPYGRDFVTHKPTGRFCNGKLATDFTAENLGFTSYPPPYLSQQAQGKNLLTGVNFASAASGYNDGTAQLYRAVSLTQQLEYFKEYKTKLATVAGQSQAASIINGSIYLISAGSSDYVQNYYIRPSVNLLYSVDQYSDLLVQSFSTFVQNLYGLGARRIGVTSLPPLGCLPAAITLFGDSNECVERLNKDAVSFNNRINVTAQTLKGKLSGLKIVVFDIYQPLFDLATKPSENGFAEGRKGCCGTGVIETSFLCNKRSIGTCANASQYVFWDGFHPTEAANNILANDLLIQGIDLIS